MSELAAILVGFLLTLFIYSYIVGDNPLYRLTVHLLVGVSAAYAAVVAVNTIFIPLFVDLSADPTSPGSLLWVIPLLLGVLLLLKWFRPLAGAGNGSVASLIGVGAAVALIGIVSGTLVPQLLAVRSDNPLLGLLTALLTICTLLYFQFTVATDGEARFRRPGWLRLAAGIGQAVLMITFGALFAGVFGTSLILLVERINFYMTGLADALGIFLS